MRGRGILGIASMIGSLTFGATAIGAADLASIIPITGLRSDPRHTGRGKHKPRRHGRKLTTNRLHVSKRVRRKHRRAA